MRSGRKLRQFIPTRIAVASFGLIEMRAGWCFLSWARNSLSRFFSSGLRRSHWMPWTAGFGGRREEAGRGLALSGSRMLATSAAVMSSIFLSGIFAIKVSYFAPRISFMARSRRMGRTPSPAFFIKLAISRGR
jgi:hypothetical protein